MDQHKTEDNLRYIGCLTRVLTTDASISLAELMVKLVEFCDYSVDLRCHLSDKGVQNADASGDFEKKEDEDHFSFACTNLDGSSISTDDIFQNSNICLVFPIFNPDLLFANAADDDFSRARGATASSSSLRPPLKKLFFEERDTPNSATSFYNSGGGLGS
ncbi:hypothetical protein L3X38_032254 [Prunus dulcis]|uniref:Uncharacterized protein n=1 Tax=Prunus dulcis TaxID=3755 RepID=A0AAD4YUT4_PRUDU|nr:hypothetical protein L3X38_032254 [Prunus dulcis]